MCSINLSSGKIYSPSSVVENRSAENKKTWFRKLLGNKNIFKNTFYGYQKYSLLILHPCHIHSDLKYDNEKKKYYWIFVLFWEKGIVYTLAELVYFMLSNDRMHAEGADWVRKYCTGISICTCTEIHTWACLYTCTCITIYLENTPYTRLKSIPGKLLRFSNFFISPEINLYIHFLQTY